MKFLKYSFNVILLSVVCVSCMRNPVTGKREIVLVPTSMESQIGQEAYIAQQEAEGGCLKDNPHITEYVRKVGQKLVDVSDRPNLPFEFVVLNNPVPNAWTLPGGKIAINSGLLKELKNEAELAAVLSHEIVHAAARHGAQSIERDAAMQLAVAGVNAASEDNEYHDMMMAGASLGATLLHFRYSREAEFEADKYGMKYMSKAGYDVNAAVELQKMFLRLSEGKESSWVEGLFASHPPSIERVKANERTAKKLPKGGYLGEKEYKAAMVGV
jgi:predicted Zn-dependent protease